VKALDLMFSVHDDNTGLSAQETSEALQSSRAILAKCKAKV
jgi:hypothetical protein